MPLNDLISRAITCYPNNHPGSLHLHLWPSGLPSQAKWRAQRLWRGIGRGCLCVETCTTEAQFHEVILGFEFTPDSVDLQHQHLGKRESLSGLRPSVVPLSCGFWRCPQFPVRSVPVWREIWEPACAAAWLSARPAHRHSNQTQSSPLSREISRLVKYGDWNLHRAASFSTSRFSFTCSNIKRLFYDNCLSYYSS